MSLKRNPLIFTPRPLAAGLGVVALTAGGMLLSPVVISPAVAENTPISSPGSYQGYKTVSGQVFVDRSGPRGELDGKQSWTAYDDSDVPLSGVKVYAQWVDDDSAKTVSPIYTSTSGDDGKYSISLPDWTDSLGNKHAFKANSTQKLRIWSENPDDSKYISSFSEGFQTFANSVQRVHGFWNSLPSSRNAVDFNVSFQERPQNDVMHLPEDKQTNLTPTKTGGDVLGTVWWDQRNNYGASGDIPGLDPAWGDKPIEGMKVRASYVQDEVARQFDKWLADNKGATLDQFRDAQKQIMKQYEADNPGKSAIAETAYALTKADGSYQIQFQGLWGDSYNYKGIVNKNKYGELAPVGQGSWAKGNLSSKHVNTKYMYVSPELPEGIGGSLDTMQTNMYQDAGRNDLYVDSNALSGVTSMDFALKQENRKFDVVEYDSTDKLAKPADTANTEASGFNPGLDYDVVWTDSAGNQVGKCTVTSSNVGKIESCPFTVPDDLDQAQIYTATIYPKGDTTTALAADNFAATPEPQYKPIEVEAGGSDTVPVPVTKAGKPLHEGTTFAAPNAQELPEGIEAGPDWATVNADGSISLAPGADVKPGEYKVPVKITYPNGQSRIIEAPVTVKEKSKTADVVDPSYGDGVSVKAGESGSVSVPKGADGSA
ncbi:MAG: Rib/alpha-like domain-containing protein, partial [Winkia neuii]